MPALPIPPTDRLDLVRDHQVRIWRYLRCLGCSAADAEDLAQETFLAVLRSPFEERTPAQTAAYLQTVARNLFLKSQRATGMQRAGLERADVDLDRQHSAWDAWAGADGGDRYVAAMRDCVAGLDGRGRTAVRLRYEEGTSRGEMAERLGLSLDGVKSLLRRVRGILRACVERRIG